MKNYSLEIKWGVIFTVVALLWMVFEKMMGWHSEKIADHATNTNYFAIVAIAIFVLALLDKKKQLGGSITWKQGFIAGLIISVVVAILTPLAQWITNSIISPEYFPNAIAHAVDSGLMDQTAAEAYFNIKTYIFAATISGLVMGAVTSAIVALVVAYLPKRN